MQRHVARSAVVRYGVAVVSVSIAVVLALSLRPLTLAGAELLLLAALVTGWVGGLRPALVAWVLATLAFKYCFTSPLNSRRNY
jgi:K+-sensing histidine kinase KdpD